MIDLGYNKKLILEDGEEYMGFAFGYTGEKVLELVFNTSMVGYQGDPFRPLLHRPGGHHDLSS